MKTLSGLSILGVLLLAATAAFAQAHYVEHELTIPWVKAPPSGLDALEVYVNLPGKHPLVILTHGSARKNEDHKLMSPWSLLPEALWFARRGWVVLAVVRRGYGASGGEEDGAHSHCPRTDYEGAAENGAEDLRIAIDYAKGLPEVDATHILAAGVSTGGLATVALTAEPPKGLVAAINFAGGRGSKADHDVCNEGDLIGTYKDLGKHSRIPMLWLYAENDKFFWPELAQKFDAAFKAGGGQDQFYLAPPIGDDGHALFRHPDAWSDTVDAFLKAHELVPIPEILPEFTGPNLAPPAGLSEKGLAAFHVYLILGPHKAFAMSEHHFAYVTASRDLGRAKSEALEHCEKETEKDKEHPEKCSVVYVDESPVHP